MSLTKSGRRPRLVDGNVGLMLRMFKPSASKTKHSGKTWTSLDHTNSTTMRRSLETNIETGSISGRTIVR